MDVEHTRRVRAPAAEARYFDNEKFWNYEIDSDAVLDALDKAIQHVTIHKQQAAKQNEAQIGRAHV